MISKLARWPQAKGTLAAGLKRDLLLRCVGPKLLIPIFILFFASSTIVRAADMNDTAQQLLAKGWTTFEKHIPKQYPIALEYFSKAKEVEPQNPKADAALAALYWRAYEEYWYNLLKVGRTQARRLVETYLDSALQTPTARAHEVDCRMKSFRAKHEEALAACEAAIALDPHDAYARHAMALALINSGKPEAALSQVREARRAAPEMEEYHGYYGGMAKFFAGAPEAALAALEGAMAAHPKLWSFEDDSQSAICLPCIMIIASLGQLGRTEEAKPLAHTFMEFHIDWTISSELFYRPLRREKDIERLREGLRKAGVPE